MKLVIAWIIFEIVYAVYSLFSHPRPDMAIDEYTPPAAPSVAPPPVITFDQPTEEMKKPYHRVVTDHAPEVWDIVENKTS